MHLVLRNDALLRVICGFLYVKWDTPGTALVALARVSRCTSDIALDFIWRKIRLEAILFLFPEGMVTPGEKSFSRLPATRRDWERFNIYAPRVRFLVRSLLFDISRPNRLIDVSSLATLRTSRQFPLFPGLTTLQWRGAPAALPDSVHLLSPCLVDVEIALVPFDVNEIATKSTVDDTLTDFLQKLADQCPRLQWLYLKSDPHARHPVLDAAIIPFFRNSALCADIATTPAGTLQILPRKYSLRRAAQRHYVELMHSVLRNDELLRVICGYLYLGWRRPGSALVALALACRSTSDIALDFIWKEIRLETVFFLFPEDIVSTETGKKAFSRPPRTLEEWTRFNLYTSRVRSLIRSLVFDVEVMTRPFHGPSLEVLACHCTLRQHPLFPNLVALTWRGFLSELPDMTYLLSPSLMAAEIELVSFDIKEVTRAVQNLLVRFLHTVTAQCPLLQQLHLHANPYVNPWESPRFEEAIIPFLRRSTLLADIMIPPSTRILQVLARMPHLRALTLGPTRELGEAPWREPPNVRPRHANKDDDYPRFTALETLSGQLAPSLSFVTHLLSGTGCIPRKAITFDFAQACTAPDVAAFLQTVTHPRLSRSLSQFHLYRDMDPSDADNTYHPGLDWEAFAPLLTFRNLTSFVVSNGVYLRTTDADLEGLARAWPALRILHLSTCYFSEEGRAHLLSHITFHGLEHLATLPHLEEAILTLDPTAGLSASLLTWPDPAAAVSPATTLRFGPSVPAASPAEVALFLLQRFPRLQTVGCVGCDGFAKLMWQEVADALEGARDVLRSARTESLGVKIDARNWQFGGSVTG